MNNEPIIKISLDLCKAGVRNVVVYADSPEARDLAIERLRECLPQIELLEQAITQQQ